VATVVIVAIAVLMILRELDVDIAPMLTGAGIVGLAVGFGAQTLVRDIISGFFLILEDQVRVGDVAAINGTGRAGRGHQPADDRAARRRRHRARLPQRRITTLANRTKDFSFYVIDLGVSYDEDPDRVAAVLREVGATLQADPTVRAAHPGAAGSDRRRRLRRLRGDHQAADQDRAAQAVGSRRENCGADQEGVRAARDRDPVPAAVVLLRRPKSGLVAGRAGGRWCLPPRLLDDLHAGAGADAADAPAATIALRPSRSRTPPAALTPISAPTTRRISATSAAVAPPGPNPVEVFTKSAPAAFDSVQAVIFSSSVRRAASMITLLTTPHCRGTGSVTASMSRSTGAQVARLQRADVDDHVDLAAPSKIARRVS
jgi:hypothetical protein